jgi:hypothetical protein
MNRHSGGEDDVLLLDPHEKHINRAYNDAQAIACQNDVSLTIRPILASEF